MQILSTCINTSRESAEGTKRTETGFFHWYIVPGQIGMQELLSDHQETLHCMADRVLEQVA